MRFNTFVGADGAHCQPDLLFKFPNKNTSVFQREQLYIFISSEQNDQLIFSPFDFHKNQLIFPEEKIKKILVNISARFSFSRYQYLIVINTNGGAVILKSNYRNNANNFLVSLTNNRVVEVSLFNPIDKIFRDVNENNIETFLNLPDKNLPDTTLWHLGLSACLRDQRYSPEELMEYCGLNNVGQIVNALNLYGINSSSDGFFEGCKILDKIDEIYKVETESTK